MIKVRQNATRIFFIHNIEILQGIKIFILIAHSKTQLNIPTQETIEMEVAKIWNTTPTAASTFAGDSSLGPESIDMMLKTMLSTCKTESHEVNLDSVITRPQLKRAQKSTK